MAKQRTYGDACRTAHALDLIGDRWALLVVRELLLGPKRFTDLRAGLPSATPDMLSQRLRDLEREGVLRHRKLDPPYGGSVYELTDWGHELETVIQFLGSWSGRSPSPPRDPSTLSPDSLILALRSHFRPESANGFAGAFELRLGDQPFRVAVADGKLETSRDSVADPDAVIEADPLTLSEALWGEGSLAAARKAGSVSFEGDQRAATRLLSLFPEMEPA